MAKMILASQSPRRRQLLEQMGFTDFVIDPAKGEEQVDPALTPDRLVEALALAKAREVAARSGRVDLIIGADTIVTVDGAVLGKPGSEEEAKEMLRRLSGREHTVYTGVAVLKAEARSVCHESTKVRFRSLTEEEICHYVSSGEPMDKAGAYGIQGLGALLIEGIDGDYFNVMGLPICRLGQMLKLFGIHAL